MRAVCDFDPRKMTCREKVELKYFLQGRIGLQMKKKQKSKISNTLQTGRLAECIRHEKQTDQRQRDKNERQRQGIESLEMWNGIQIDRGVHGWKDDGRVSEFDPSRQDKLMNSKDELMMLENKGRPGTEERYHTRNQEEAFNMEELETVVQKLEQITDENALHETNRFDERSHGKTVDPFAMVLTFKRGEKMQTLPPANVG